MAIHLSEETLESLLVPIILPMFKTENQLGDAGDDKKLSGNELSAVRVDLSLSV